MCIKYNFWPRITAILDGCMSSACMYAATIGNVCIKNKMYTICFQSAVASLADARRDAESTISRPKRPRQLAREERYKN